MLDEDDWRTIERVLGRGRADELGAALEQIEDLHHVVRMLLGEYGDHISAATRNYLERTRAGELGSAAAAAGPMAEPDEPGLTNNDTLLGVLVALLMSFGGSYELPTSAFASDALGHVDGSSYSVEVQPVDRSHVRVAVVARAEHSRPQPS